MPSAHFFTLTTSLQLHHTPAGWHVQNSFVAISKAQVINCLTYGKCSAGIRHYLLHFTDKEAEAKEVKKLDRGMSGAVSQAL